MPIVVYSFNLADKQILDRKMTDNNSSKNLIESLVSLRDGDLKTADFPTEKWLAIEFKVLLISMCIAEIGNFVIFLVFLFTDNLERTVFQYVTRFLLLPVFLEFLAIYLARRALKKNSPHKILILNLACVFEAFVFYSAHKFFPCMLLVFIFPFVICIPYGDLKISRLVSGCTLGSKIFSDVFIFWDRKFLLRSPPEMILQLSPDFFISIIILGVVALASASIIRIEKEKISTLQTFLANMLFDSLTEVGNPAALRLYFEKMKSSRDKTYFLVMLDLDLFKSINDDFGHQTGDKYLAELAKFLRQVKGAECFRYGGDEFTLIFKDATKEFVKRELESLREKFQGCNLCQTVRPLSLSLGVKEWDGQMEIRELVRLADQALYKAKETRNAVIFA